MHFLDLSSRVPIYEQLYNNVVKQIASGILKPGDKLPTVRATATEMGINPNTVSKAYSMLEKDGYIISAVGRGSFVSRSTDGIDTARKTALEEFCKAAKTCKLYGADVTELQQCLTEAFKEDDDAQH